MQTAAPVVLNSGTIALNAANARKPPTNESNLTMDTPWWLDEIIFTSEDSSLYGSSIWAKLQIGNIPITKDFIPVQGFCEKPNNAEYYTFKWRLAKPIYVPPLVYLQPTLFLSAVDNVAPSSANFAVTYIGRRATEASPKTVWLPYVAGFQGTPVPTSTAQKEESTEYDLANPFSSEIVIDYITGVVDGYNGDQTPIFDPGLIYRNTYMRIVDKDSRILIRDRTQFGAVFPNTTRSWRCRGAKMPPRGYYLVYLEEDYSTAAKPGPNQVQITMVARRLVELAKLQLTAK